MSRSKTQLVDGLVPSGKQCPFKNFCGLEICDNRDINKAFSCGAARAFDLCKDETLQSKGCKDD